ncbi:hypothetical protein GTV32_23100 [Gordonia sp. SID5947]|uniref:hypothetical protein n=1 Tax=Gordonia sp. SID5947 TaxID=2690315 RepID=UPI00136FA4E7|nr:hypothetical protein [Gordonia sp. SID5947]MYR08963.1 hypothetical protein [Gordonia sp. SID5947]MYR09020.1 hypothetical protein [Gordonia sp. SID5947]
MLITALSQSAHQTYQLMLMVAILVAITLTVIAICTKRWGDYGCLAGVAWFFVLVFWSVAQPLLS